MQNKNRKIQGAIALAFLAAAIVIWIAWNTGPFFYHFAGWRLVTLYSLFQLMATAFVCFLICKTSDSTPSANWRRNASIRPFLIAGAGFFFLGLDEILSIHENLDKLIHIILRIKETPLTDHLDDVIVLIYGLIALVFIKDFIREFRKQPYMIALLVFGFMLFFTMFALDFVSNSVESFLQFFSNGSYGELVHERDVFRMAEDTAKILGETCFLAAFLGALVNIRAGRDKG